MRGLRVTHPGVGRGIKNHPSDTPPIPLLTPSYALERVTQAVKTAQAMVQGLSRAMGKLGRDALRATKGFSQWS